MKTFINLFSVLLLLTITTNAFHLKPMGDIFQKAAGTSVHVTFGDKDSEKKHTIAYWSVGGFYIIVHVYYIHLFLED